jgi:hypothetical protein
MLPVVQASCPAAVAAAVGAADVSAALLRQRAQEVREQLNKNTACTLSADVAAKSSFRTTVKLLY